MPIGDARLFSHDPQTGLTEYYYADPENDGFLIETVQDVERHVELVKTLESYAPARWGDGKMVAMWPAVVSADLIKRGILDDPDAMKHWLNSDEAKPWRTRRGRV